MDLGNAQRIATEAGWLAQQPEEFRHEVFSRTFLKAFAQGEFIYQLEDPPGMMFCIAEGAVLIGVAHPVIGVCQVHLGRRGDWFGEGGAVYGVTRRLAIEALTPMEALCLSSAAVQEMLQVKPTWERNFSALLFMNVETILRTASDLLINMPLARVSARLSTLCGSRIGREPMRNVVELPLTQAQLATMCGLSRKSVHLALNQLEAEGLCKNGYGSIVVLSPEALEKRLMSIGIGE